MLITNGHGLAIGKVTVPITIARELKSKRRKIGISSYFEAA